MREHLSHWQIEELVIDQAGHPARQHLASCERCRSEKERLEQVLFLYQSAVVSETNRISAYRHTAEPRKRAPAVPFLWRWSLALLLLLVVVIPVHLHHRRQLRQAAEITRDNLLLQQVVEEISDSVPQPMESLTHLVLTDENSTASGQE